jgi:DNA topoisomerase-1
MKKIHYITSEEKGITRTLHGKKMQYFSIRGQLISNEKILSRIKSLRIPPAYKNVWICPATQGHIQAYGFDSEGRKQYIYHPQWTLQQTRKKFSHLIEFGESLSKIRHQINLDLKQPPLSKNHSLAGVIRFLEVTCIRIGSPQYHSYGLLTLNKTHCKISKDKITLDFLGKSKKQWHLEIRDKTLYNMITLLYKKQGNKIFKYEANNKICLLKAKDVNNYLKDITGREITAKEFRTWLACSYFIGLALKNDKIINEALLKKLISKTASYIVNTPAVCKNSYLHPLLLKLFLKGQLNKPRIKKIKLLSLEESYLIHLLKKEGGK